jgi:outer membrane receptor protein involved in Fe transport
MTMKKILTSLLVIPFAGNILAQNTIIEGVVSDAKIKETIIGANIIVDGTPGTVTDINGVYSYKTKPGTHKLEFKYIGYKPQLKVIDIDENETLKLNVLLETDSKTLDIVVVSAGKFEQNLNEVTVSMEVIKPSLAENKALTSIDKAVNQVPGVNIIDRQANIRGGSGFSYGAGSRVLIMVDEMPMLTATQGDVKWDFLPIENCEQIEVIKGASSALFGSSAMNGVINFRTAYAKDQPETKIVFATGIYDDPRRKELIWWKGGNPIYTGMNFYHAEKIKNLDVLIGGNIHNDNGYRYLEDEQRYRVNGSLRYRFKKIPGLAVGVNFNTMSDNGGLFTLWENPDSALYPSGLKTTRYTSFRTNIDPFVTFLTKDGTKHSLRTRYFKTTDLNSTNQSSVGETYYAEYQFQKHYKNGLTWTSGLVYNYNEVHSAAIYGNHFSTNVAVFTQIDKKFDRLSLSLGVRGEYFKTDTVEIRENIYLLMDESKVLAKQSKVKPVFRAGVNYRLAKATFLRASFGQGFRFPSVAERYIKTNGGGFSIYPNDSLKPERGWSSEFGVKQGFAFGGSWKGYLDVAAFWTEYKNMMEFTFGQYAPYVSPSDPGYGFQSQNIGNTRIRGIDASIMAIGKIGPVDVSFMVGYTYLDPRQTDFDVAIDTTKNTSKTNLLKYRFENSGKADLEFGYKAVTMGADLRANSYMRNVDSYFTSPAFFPGISQYREEHNKGDYIIDYRFSCQMNKTTKVAFIVNNVLNREVMDRPGNLQQQRSYVLQLTIKI